MTLAELMAPRAYRRLLRNRPWLRPEGRARVTSNRSALEVVHRGARRRFVYVPDQEEQWGVFTKVRRMFGSGFLVGGDCDDFVVLCLERLTQHHGVHRSALRMVQCWTESGQAHLVLHAATPDGVLVLDNRQSRVMAMESLPYRWGWREVLGE